MSDFTLMASRAGTAYVALFKNAFSQRILGILVLSTMNA